MTTLILWLLIAAPGSSAINTFERFPTEAACMETSKELASKLNHVIPRTRCVKATVAVLNSR